LSASFSPEELLAQLAQTVALDAVCIPPAVRRERPRLAPVAARQGMVVSLEAVGHEDVVCALVEDPGEAARAAATAVAALPHPPFLLLIPATAADEGAALAAAARLTAGGGWLVRDLATGAGPALLAPAERMLGAGALAGDWSGAGGELAERILRGEDLVDVLWRAADRDRAALDAIARRVADNERQADEARQRAERMAAEIGQLRDGERRELQRLRLEVLEERAWVGDQALRIATSTSWRLGHRLTKMGRRLALKPDRGTDLPRQIAARMRNDDR